ncbi:MAG TPA: hypothetical protein VK684_03230 [Edaphobacter sp.]|jgi:hypothetical protein|nr:hypothetical protein [Edaphobacter sp.]
MVQRRLESLQRLVTLYAAVEEMHSTELQRMTAAVREVQQVILAEQEVAWAARLDGRGALLAEDRLSWMMAETQQESAAWRRRRLEQIRVERQELNDAAREQYVSSRLKREQLQRVFDDIAVRIEIEKERRVQAASDDRFLARRRWTDARERMQTKQ